MRDRYDAMMPLEEYKKLLGSFALKLSEEQVIKLHRQEFEIANAIFELWLRRRNAGCSLDDSS
jgi:hypothetical protein